MWSSRLFWKLFLAYTGLILLAAVLFAVIVSARQEQQVLAYLRERLHDDAVLLRSHILLNAGREEDMRDLTQRLAKETETRITVISDSGTVLADSDQDPALMESHGDRPEVVDARSKGEGIRIHVSRTLGVPMMYLALRMDDSAGELKGFVRVALPMQTVEERVGAVRRLVWAIALLIGLATLAVTYWVVVRITRPLSSLTQAAQAIASGRFGEKVYVPNRDELGSLGEAFNRMSIELASYVTQMRENEARLATVLGGMVEGVIAVDARQRFLFANEAARELLGLPTADLAGRPLWELVRHRAVQQAVQYAFHDGQPGVSEFETTGPARRVVALHARRLPGDPSPGVVLVFHDVTELRRLENLRRDFVANVSHELKTPLSSIKAYTETLLSGALADSDHNVTFVRQIEEQADRLHQLILDLLSLARIESGQEAFEIAAVTVSDVVGSCMAQHAAAAAAKGIALETNPWPGAMRVLADEEGVREILNNLLDNAIKYTPSGGCVTVRWRPEHSMGLIEVEDTGIGIATQEQARIFERFYRVDKARSRELGGTGLGLAIVKHLVQAFGGGVSLSSEVGRGSTFSVRLPLV